MATINIDARKMSSTEAARKFLEFYTRKENLDTKYKELEKELKTMNETLKPFTVRNSSICISGNKKLFFTRREIAIYNNSHSDINKFKFFRELREVPIVVIESTREYVRKKLKDYIVPYLKEGLNLLDEVVCKFEIPDTDLILQMHFDDELVRMTVGKILIINGDVNLLQTRYNDKEDLFLYADRPFSMIGIRGLNGVLIQEQFPELYDYWKIGLDRYKELIQNNEQVLKKMESIISPFLIAKKLGRKDGKN